MEKDEETIYYKMVEKELKKSPKTSIDLELTLGLDKNHVQRAIRSLRERGYKVFSFHNPEEGCHEYTLID